MEADPAESRALGTLHKDKALPPLGQALDMRDSRPAEKLDRTLWMSGFLRPTVGIYRAAEPWSQKAAR